MHHPFDRYAAFTDLTALKAASDRPLRKALRINTLKCSPEFFHRWAKEKGWQTAPIPWCPQEGFFIERENREEALGKDLLHLMGYTYMQEASSMLPVALLDPQPGELILDMAAAPGSKTTQIAARMQARGVVIANDVQEKRLWVLKSALHRLGITNAIVTKKVGQWFGKHMSERFDRVLCDAPCTAQGTARKDTTALSYSSLENVQKMAQLQRQLLESAIHACKVGGRIVYSTCTLTPEENEEIITWILEKFSGKIDVIDPATIGLSALQQGIDDSRRVQDSLEKTKDLPLVRLWPQTFDSEGFFSAVLTKTGSTAPRENFTSAHFQEEWIPKARVADVAKDIGDRFGVPFILEGDTVFSRNEQLLLATREVAEMHLPVQDYSLGLPLARKAGERGLRIDHESVTLRGAKATKNVFDLIQEQLDQLFDGKDISCPADLHGDTILRFKDIPIGLGLAKEGTMKNRLPRWIVQKS